jgi:hypothetical protein
MRGRVARTDGLCLQVRLWRGKDSHPGALISPGQRQVWHEARHPCSF